MAKGDGLTHNQHYIPQVYLRGFSKDDNSVFFFDLASCKSSNKAVPVKTICVKRDLYEAKDEQGDYLFANHIEKALCNLEGMFSEYRTKLKNKAFNKENYRTKCFLTHEEKGFWITYVAVQIMRSPKVLSVAKNFSKEFFQDNVSEYKSENIALSSCLPFFSELFEENENAFSTFLKPMLNMSFNIGVAQGDKELFTSDNPVYIRANGSCDEYDIIIFPISSKLCLVMFGEEYKEYYRKNSLFPIDEEMLKKINRTIVWSADRMLFSSKRLSKKQEEEICRIYKQRVEGDERLFGDSDLNHTTN